MVAGGFVLPSGARRAADVSWISRKQLVAIGSDKVELWWRGCPEFVVEVRSPYDRTRTVRARMLEWVEIGAQLAWLVDPKTKSIEIFTPHSEPQTISEAFRFQVNRRSMVLFSISRECGTRLQAEVLVDGFPRRLRRN